MNLFDKTMREIYGIKSRQMESRKYCKVCKYDAGYLHCTSDNVMECPAVVAQVTILKAGIFGVEPYVREGWMKNEE